jgi:hypothetical protein
MATIKTVYKLGTIYVSYTHKSLVALFSTGIQATKEEFDNEEPPEDSIEMKISLKLKAIADSLIRQGKDPETRIVSEIYKNGFSKKSIESLRSREKELNEQLKEVRALIKKARISAYIVEYRQRYKDSKGYARKVIEKKLGFKLDASNEEIEELLLNKQIQLRIERQLKNEKSKK